MPKLIKDFTVQWVGDFTIVTVEDVVNFELYAQRGITQEQAKELENRTDKKMFNHMFRLQFKDNVLYVEKQ